MLRKEQNELLAQTGPATIRRLIERRVPIDPADLADPTKPLAGLLKSKIQPSQKSDCAKSD